jgi:hypothetical protein
MRYVSATKYKYLSLAYIFKKYTSEKAVTVPEDKHPVLNQANHGSYGSLLFDQRWKSKRAEILIRDSNFCVLCKSAEHLQVHHRQYHFIKVRQEFKPPWEYTNNLLITLCSKCHQKGHKLFKVPTIYL